MDNIVPQQTSLSVNGSAVPKQNSSKKWIWIMLGLIVLIAIVISIILLLPKSPRDEGGYQNVAPDRAGLIGEWKMTSIVQNNVPIEVFESGSLTLNADKTFTTKLKYTDSSEYFSEGNFDIQAEVMIFTVVQTNELMVNNVTTSVFEVNGDTLRMRRDHGVIIAYERS